MRRLNYLHVAMTIPLLGIIGMLANSEYRATQGHTWRLEIVGYDPRDLIHGHYLRYNYIVSLTNPLSPHPEERIPKNLNQLDADDRGQVLCFIKHLGKTVVIQLEPASLSEYECDSQVNIKELSGPKKYLIPEASAAQLETALAAYKSSVDIIIDAKGGVMVGDLYLEGRPWRDVIGKEE
ncbi:MAG: GDYXXLXY domain-containing protein [Bradymonadia bacterium]